MNANDTAGGRHRHRHRHGPAAFLVATLASTALTLGQPFRSDIDRWTAQDTLQRPAAGSIVFTGSSSIRRWEQLALDFRDYKIIQRGFGGSQFDDLNRYVQQIVLPYAPAAIVVWSGTNDIAAGADGEEVATDYEEFIAAVQAAQPEVEIFYMGIMPTPGRFGNRARETVANTAIARRTATDPHLHYIDLPASFANLNPPAAPAFTSLFVDDIHLNRQGYAFWTSIVRPRVAAVIRPNKIFHPNPRTPQPGSRLLFDFGPSNPEDGDPTLGPDANGNHWNNWHAAQGGMPVNAGEHLGDLVDAQGRATGVDLVITGGFSTQGKRQGGLLAPVADRLGDLAVPTATEDYFFSSADNKQGGGNDDRPGGFMLTGLDPNLCYSFRFFGSRSDAKESCVTEFLVTGVESQRATLTTTGPGSGTDGDYDGNDSQVANVNGIRPDRFGQIFVDLTVAAGNCAYLNAMAVAAPTDD